MKSKKVSGAQGAGVLLVGSSEAANAAAAVALEKALPSSCRSCLLSFKVLTYGTCTAYSSMAIAFALWHTNLCCANHAANFGDTMPEQQWYPQFSSEQHGC